MENKLIFCLSGCGYLQDVITREGGFFAQIKMIPSFDLSKSRDDVLVEVETEEHDAQILLTHYLSKVRANDQVLLAFEAEYSAFLHAYSGCTIDDPNHIVMIRCKLRKLSSCYINGQLERGDLPRLVAIG